MKQDNWQKGQAGEEAAVKFLTGKGYKILERNFRTRFGEIDIIAREKRKGRILPITVFVEVKTKMGDSFGEPWEMMDERKLAKVRQMGELYLMKKGLGEVSCRIDVVGVWLDSGGEVEKIEHWENVDMI